MADQPGRFSIHSTRRSPGKRAAGIAGLVVLLTVIGVAAYADTCPEKVLVGLIESRNPLGAPAAYLLGVRGVKTDAARKALMDALDSGASETPAPAKLRSGAAYALGTTLTHEAIVTLATAIQHDPDKGVKAAACRSIGRSGEGMLSEPALELGLDDQDPEVRKAACDGAGLLKDNRLVDRLISLVSDNEYGVRAYAVRALQATTGQEIGIDNVEWTRWRDHHR